MFDIFFRGPNFAAVVCYMCLINAFCPQNQRTVRSWAWRCITAVVTGAALMAFFRFAVDPANASTVLEQPVCLLVTWLYALLVLKMQPGKAAYGTIMTALISESAGMLIQRFTSIFRSWDDVPRLIVVILLTVGLAAGLALLLRKIVVKVMLHDGNYIMSRRKLMLSMVVLVLYLVLSNYQLIFWLGGSASSLSVNIVLTFRVMVGVLAVLILFIQNDIEKSQKTQQELQMLTQMWHRQQEQYKLSKENIEIINRKCHDLRHQMAALRSIKDKDEIDRQVAEMENAIMIYDSVIRTGNPVLDVVLTEKSLYCDAHQINMTCLVDGKLLSFIDTVDLYTLFGNALDNAIESVMQQKDKQKRVIQVAAYEERNMLLIRFRNFCDQKLELVDGLPVTNKDDGSYHGFGLKSIRHTAEKYGGGISIQTGSSFFSLQVLIPMNREQ